jgi:threonine/homoserine/homoserine lactone efflux protein
VDVALPDPSSLGLFVATALVLLLTPGPAVLCIVTRSLDQGHRAGLVSVLGVHGPAQIVCLGVVFVALGMVTDGFYALTAGAAAPWLRARRGLALTRRWIPGTIYIGLGLATALSSSHRK